MMALRRTDPDRGVGFEQADEDGGQDRAAEVAHAADHDDDERLQHPVEPHGVVDADQRAEQHSRWPAAMPAPMANTPGVHPGHGMPIACAITRSCVVARIQMP
jgi:hypothetical protein